MQKLVYCDYSATTYVKKEVLEEMLPYFTMNFGNASAIYSLGRVSKKAIEESREKVANTLNCKKNEVYFTASGSEADNMILLGIARANRHKGNHIITSKVEHLAVLNTCHELEKEGFEVTYINVNKNGVIDLNELQNSIRDNTILISVMTANNEVGTYQPIEKIGEIAKAHSVIFHTDAVQAIGNLDIDVERMNIDALSLSAHKFYGPKGIGAAYIKNNIEFDPVILGGHQEHCKRAGTENVAGIVGIGKAIELAKFNLIEHNNKILNLRNILLNYIKRNIDGAVINADIENKLPGNISFYIKGIDSRSLVMMLDMNGICASSGSACNSQVQTPSHVLTAMGMKSTEALSTVRISLGDMNTLDDIEYIYYILKDIVYNIKSN